MVVKKRFFRKTNNKDTHNNKLVGISVPTNLTQYLTLYCVAHKCSKTSIIRPLIESWVDSMQKEISESRLIEEIAVSGYVAYKSRPKRGFIKILRDQKKELVRVGINEKIVDKIIKAIINAKSKED